jgi:hypothetical protein
MSHSEPEEILPHIDLDRPILIDDGERSDARAARVQRRRGEPYPPEPAAALHPIETAQAVVPIAEAAAEAAVQKAGSALETPRFAIIVTPTALIAASSGGATGLTWLQAQKAPLIRVDHESLMFQLQGDEYDADEEDLAFLQRLNARGGFTARAAVVDEIVVHSSAPSIARGQAPKQAVASASQKKVEAPTPSRGTSKSGKKKRPRPASDDEDEDDEEDTVTDGSSGPIPLSALEQAIELLEKEAFIRVATARIDAQRRKVLAAQASTRKTLQGIASRLAALQQKAAAAAIGGSSNNKAALAMLSECIKTLTESDYRDSLASSSDGSNDSNGSSSSTSFARLATELKEAADTAAEGAGMTLPSAASSSASSSSSSAASSSYAVPSLSSLFPEADAIEILCALDWSVIPNRELPTPNTTTDEGAGDSDSSSSTSSWALHPFKPAAAAASTLPSSSSSLLSSAGGALGITASPRPRAASSAATSSSSSSGGKKGAPAAANVSSSPAASATKTSGLKAAATSTAKKASAPPSAKRAKREPAESHSDEGQQFPALPSSIKLSEGAAAAIYRHWLSKHHDATSTGWLLRCFHHLQGDSFADAPAWALARIVGTGQMAPLPAKLAQQLAVASGGITATIAAMTMAAASAGGNGDDGDSGSGGGRKGSSSSSSSSSSAGAGSNASSNIALSIINGNPYYPPPQSGSSTEPTPASLTFTAASHAIVNGAGIDVVRRRQRLEQKATAALVAHHRAALSSSSSSSASSSSLLPPLRSAEELTSVIPFPTEAALLDGGFSHEAGIHPLVLPGHASSLTTVTPYTTFETGINSWKVEKGTMAAFGGFNNILASGTGSQQREPALPIPALISGRGLVRDVDNNCRALGRIRRLRHHLEKLRVLVDLARKRERLKKERAKHVMTIVHAKVSSIVGQQDPDAAKRLLYLPGTPASQQVLMPLGEAMEVDDEGSVAGKGWQQKGKKKGGPSAFQRLAAELEGSEQQAEAEANTGVFEWSTTAAEEHAISYTSQRPGPLSTATASSSSSMPSAKKAKHPSPGGSGKKTGKKAATHEEDERDGEAHSGSSSSSSAAATLASTSGGSSSTSLSADVMNTACNIQ